MEVWELSLFLFWLDLGWKGKDNSSFGNLVKNDCTHLLMFRLPRPHQISWPHFIVFYMYWWHLKSSARLCLQLKIKGWLALGQQKFCFSFLVLEQTNQLRDILWHHLIISRCFGVISFKILLERIAHWSNHKGKKTSHNNVREDVCLSLYISLVKHQELKKSTPNYWPFKLFQLPCLWCSCPK